MFFEDLENRQLFSIGIPSSTLVLPKAPIIPTLTVAAKPVTTAKSAVTTVTVKAPVSIVTTPAPSQSAVLKPAVTAAIGTMLQGTADPAKFAGNPLGGTQTLPGGLTISLNPNDRPSAADLGAANGFKSVFDAWVGDALSSLLSQYGKSSNPLDDAMKSPTDPTARTDFMTQAMADLEALTGVGGTPSLNVGGIDPRQADGDVAGGVGVNPTDAEVQAAIKARQAKDAAPATTTTTTTTPAPATDSAADTAKSVGATVLDYLKEVVIEKFGPPGPATTVLGAPGFVEKVTGDSKDLLNGFVAIFHSGDKDPRNNPGELTSPDGDVKLEPQQQKIINQAMAYFAKWLHPTNTLADMGTSLISQPVRGDDGSIAPKPSKEELTGNGQAPQKDMSPYINPGSGDDGNVPLTGATGPLKPKAIVKDPPNPSLDSGAPVTPPSTGLSPTSGTTPSSSTPNGGK